MDKIDNIVRYCKNSLDFSVKLGDEYFYNSLPFCVVDAVFSIGVTYASTKKSVKNFADFFHLQLFRNDKTTFPAKDKQLSISEFLKLYKQYNCEYFAENIYKNRQRTSTTNGILKSEAVKEFALVLQQYKVEYFQDIDKILNNPHFENDIKAIKGQGSGISLSYFYMLAGNDEKIKPDRMVLRFLKNILGYEPKLQEAGVLLQQVATQLQNEYPNLTPRLLDHMIWLYQKERGVV